MVKIGEIVDNAIVRRVDPTIGLLLELPSKSTSTAGYVHVMISSTLYFILDSQLTLIKLSLADLFLCNARQY